MRIFTDRQTTIGNLFSVIGIILIGQPWLAWKEFQRSGNNLFWNQPLLADGVAGDVSITSFGLTFTFVALALILIGVVMARYAYLARRKKVESKKKK